MLAWLSTPRGLHCLPGCRAETASLCFAVIDLAGTAGQLGTSHSDGATQVFVSKVLAVGGHVVPEKRDVAMVRIAVATIVSTLERLVGDSVNRLELAITQS